ncbi:HAD-IA family hydrolase [Pseudohoeflea coraliihabitans]|uniref:HAD-IA family hydrolase n=1 Tax=Pseudohoeflea coraliihabitans TaxID=2860393 RepID=A0ABS6WSY3_9HYPH|nr:HAD-IA family hydrolase [Pseudohoeflea sp. DP4N28-3]MBW3098532.1 HAD-IA family hydrolase [Pseudohoeflea sp. DP4N28-3]
MKLVLFDCDGTLVDSADVIHHCMAATFRDFDIAEPDMALTRSIIGLSLDHAIARMLLRDIDDEIAAMTARYKENFIAYRNAGNPLEPLFKGIAPLLAACRQEPDLLLGVVTGKSRRGLKAILGHHGLETTFTHIRTADDCPSKPHPAMVLECCADAGIEPDSTLVIGDAVYDMQMASSAGATAIGVSWGYAPVDHLRRAGADHIAGSADDIAGLIGLAA